MEKEGTPVGRIQTTASVTAAVAGGAVGFYAFATGRPVLRTTLPITANCVIAMTALAAAEEGVGALRGGVDDAWGALAAGSVTGALLLGLRSGPRYMLLGAVTWGPAAAAAHALNARLQPGAALRQFLISQALLDDAPPAAGAPSAEAAAAAAAGGAAEQPWRAHARQKEAAARDAEQRAAAAGAVAAAVEQEERRRWWFRRSKLVEVDTPVELPGEEGLDFDQLPKRRQSLLVEQLKRREMRELNERLQREAQARERQ